MSNVQTVLEKLRREVAECLFLSNVATDPEKRQLFARVAEQIGGLASAVQSELAAEPARAIDAAGPMPANVIAIADHDKADAADLTLPAKPVKKSRHMRPWLVAAVLVAAAGGAFVLLRAEKDSLFPALEAKADPPQAPQQEAKETLAEFRSAEENKRKLLTQQLDVLAARIDHLEKAHAEVVPPAAAKGDAETSIEPETSRQTLIEPPAKHYTETRPARHRRASSSSSHRRRSGWQLFGATQFRF